MKKNGYTISELLILMGILGVATIIFLTKTSYAFKNNQEENYNMTVSMILKAAEDYGETSEVLQTTKEEYITVGELVDKGHILLDSESSVEDPRNEGKTLDGLRIHLKIDDKDKIVAEVVD